jgi:hypothetical protein
MAKDTPAKLSGDNNQAFDRFSGGPLPPTQSGNQGPGYLGPPNKVPAGGPEDLAIPPPNAPMQYSKLYSRFGLDPTREHPKFNQFWGLQSQGPVGNGGTISNNEPSVALAGTPGEPSDNNNFGKNRYLGPPNKQTVGGVK